MQATLRLMSQIHYSDVPLLKKARFAAQKSSIYTSQHPVIHKRTARIPSHRASISREAAATSQPNCWGRPEQKAEIAETDQARSATDRREGRGRERGKEEVMEREKEGTG